MIAAVAVDEYLWNGITYDPDEPNVTGYRIISDLPRVVGSDVACPVCGQTLDVICGDALVVPQRHYRQPTVVRGHRDEGGRQRIIRVGTADSWKGAELSAALCPIDGDMLNGVIARAQRDAVMVST